VRFTVDQALDGKAGEIKEYVLALEVFDKDTSFDPRLDTSVRVEARRLRAALVSYYATAGRDDTILIEYPKGSYAPVFQLRQEAGSQQQQRLETAALDGPASSRLPFNWRRVIVYALPMLFAASAIFWAFGGKRLWSVHEPASPANQITSIAVLPFVDMSAEKDQEYFCDGLSEELIHALTKLPGLHVVARTSAFQFKQKTSDIRQIGQQLHVGAVLEGSVRKEGRKLRITAQLNTTADGYHLWSEAYERDLNDVFRAQEDIARAITKTLKISLAGRTEPLVDRGSDDTEAHNLYLQGRYFSNKFTPKAIEQSIPYFEQAIAKDPKYALAYVGLADAYGRLGYEGTLPPAEGSAKRNTYLTKAFELNSGDVQGSAALTRWHGRRLALGTYGARRGSWIS
jgi:TolB-like protein